MHSYRPTEDEWLAALATLIKMGHGGRIHISSKGVPMWRVGDAVEPYFRELKWSYAQRIIAGEDWKKVLYL